MIRRRTLAITRNDWDRLAHLEQAWAQVRVVDDDLTSLLIVQHVHEHADGARSTSIALNSAGAVQLGDDSGPFDLIRVAGADGLILRTAIDVGDIGAFGRQLLAIGAAGQRVLRQMCVAVVGYGGTGSAAFELLVRLGVGTIIVVDFDDLENTNVTRVHGSGIRDVDHSKVDLAVAHAEAIGLGTTVIPIRGSVVDQAVAHRLRTVDAIFACTDDHAGRGVLSRLAYRYLVPLFDTGVTVRTIDDELVGVAGRVLAAGPGLPCLHCCGQIDGATAAAELLDRAERRIRAREGYAPDLAGPEPAVGAYTTVAAGLAVAEFIHRIIGLDGLAADQMLIFDRQRINRRDDNAVTGHYCTDTSFVGGGDCEPFLDITWPT